MKNNNGKIAIAIVAMFVVALSIVGFTYAYFTAQVDGNDANESVKVTAGELVISYNNTKTMTAKNVVPGWISDGDKFYDPIKSIKDFDGITGITAASYKTDGTTITLAQVKDLESGEMVNDYESVEAKLRAQYGLTDPAEFNVKNEGTDAAAYSVDLNINVTGISDPENFYVYLYESDSEITDLTAQGVKTAYSRTLKAIMGEGTTITNPVTVIADRTLTNNGDSKYYKLVLEYKEADKTGVNDSDNQDASQDAIVSVTVDVNGLEQTATTVATAGE